MTDDKNDGLAKYMQDVEAFDEKFDLQHLTDPLMLNLAFHANALAGEVGELCNIVKKLWRDGETPELLDKLDEELVDILIYMIQIIRTVDTDFDAVWEDKHEVLHQRWGNSSSNRFWYDPKTNQYIIGMRADQC